jgi:hypothetical protein
MGVSSFSTYSSSGDKPHRCNVSPLGKSPDFDRRVNHAWLINQASVGGSFGGGEVKLHTTSISSLAHRRPIDGSLCECCIACGGARGSASGKWSVRGCAINCR